jgi:hypothetical protein
MGLIKRDKKNFQKGLIIRDGGSIGDTLEIIKIQNKGVVFV